jgi:hypothetical protein
MLGGRRWLWMRNVRLGKTELEVSAIALGTWSYGGEWGAFDTTQATRTIQTLSEQNARRSTGSWPMPRLWLAPSPEGM